MGLLSRPACIFALIACASCTTRNLNYVGPDMVSPPNDLASTSNDFATAQHDLANGSHDLSVPADLAMPLPDFAGDDLAGRVCHGGGGTCALTQGPHCGAVCCKFGEWCDNGTCRCGTGAACTAGNMCATGVPTPGGNSCGEICCGATGPCPL